jgi:predicted nuclease of predicted toxin-antitoxin system
MRIVVDMNLSPEWVDVLERHGFKSSHWRDIGDPAAPDVEILEWARKYEHLVFTNDLDFGRLLALTYAKGPSVLQIRGGMLLPENAEQLVLTALSQCRADLENGALVTVDESSWKVRTLPIK